MSKLEMIRALLDNELPEFEKDENRLEDSIKQAENLQVKFDTESVEGLISKLQNYGGKMKISDSNICKAYH